MICFVIFFLIYLKKKSSITGSRYIHLTGTDTNSFLFMAELYSIVYMYHIFFIHSSVNEHLSCFLVQAVVNSTAVNTGTCVFLNYGFLKYMPSGGVGGSYGRFIPSLLRNLCSP